MSDIKDSERAELHIISEENLDAAATQAFMENAFRDGAVPTAGTAITKVLPPVSPFSADDAHSTQKRTVLEKLNAFFERFFGLSSGSSHDE